MQDQTNISVITKKINFYLIKYFLILFFDPEIYPHIKTELQYNATNFPLKQIFITLDIL